MESIKIYFWVLISGQSSPVQSMVQSPGFTATNFLALQEKGGGF